LTNRSPKVSPSNIIAVFKMARRQKQLEMPLPATPRWGGRRIGAGRKPTGIAGMRHASRDHFPRTLPTHVTLRVRPDVPSLRVVAIVHEVERSFARGCVRPGFRLVHYSLQRNHAHLIVEVQDCDALGRGMKCIGARLARAVNRIARRRGPVVADRYHSRLLKSPTEVHRALRYVLLNSRKHAGKRISANAFAAREDRVVLDPASSARWFDGWKPLGRLVTGRDIPPAGGKPPVARARTWLLVKGWRRLGLLDPTSVPG
jgi:hypothetical protein